MIANAHQHIGVRTYLQVLSSSHYADLFARRLDRVIQQVESFGPMHIKLTFFLSSHAQRRSDWKQI